ncbi:MAG: hypothetical protein RBS39_08385 [Phycisphaerales bacterium]|jgi:hypothetical protein|nr:hypothetical protein [Phycisphaerales bacterium]
MGAMSDVSRLGPYRLLKPLRPSDLCERWRAVHEVERTSHVVHRFQLSKLGITPRAFLEAVERAAGVREAHVLEIEKFCLAEPGWACAVTPYTGSADGLLPLSTLLEAKGGQASPIEGERTALQLLAASIAGAEAGVAHGPIAMDDVLVDRHGRLLIEFYGLRAMLLAQRTGPEFVRDEVRSIAEITYRVVTGVAPSEPRIRAGRLVRKLEKRFDNWLESGLSPTLGFASAAEALDSLRPEREAVITLRSAPARA